MFRFFRDLCGKSDEERLAQAIETSPKVFNGAICSSAFSSESNSMLSMGAYLIRHLDEIVDESLEVEDKML